MLGHVCGCALGEGNVKWIQPPGETILYGLSISEPHLHTFHALFRTLKIGLVVQVYPEVRISPIKFPKVTTGFCQSLGRGVFSYAVTQS